MNFKINLTTVGFNMKNESKKALNNIFLGFYFFVITFYFACPIFNPDHVEASMIQNDKLIQKISKDYTKKFCNGIAFGLSKDSAMNFAAKENKLIFQKKKGIDSLNMESLASEIAISTIEECGFSLGLKSEADIKEFEKDYLSINNSFSNEIS